MHFPNATTLSPQRPLFRGHLHTLARSIVETSSICGTLCGAHTLVEPVSDSPNVQVLVTPKYPLYVTRDDRRAARRRDDDEGCNVTEDDKAIDGETPECR